MADPKLKEAMAEIRSVCTKHDIAGYITLVSKIHSEFGLEVTPSWSAAYWEDKAKGQLRMKVKTSEVGRDRAKEMLQLTCHMVYQIRDLCAQGFYYMQTMTELIEKQVEVDHTPFAGFEPHEEH